MREPKFALDGCERHADDFSSLLERESPEVPLFDDPPLPWIDRLQTHQRIVEIGKGVGLRVGRDQVIVKLDDFGAAATPRGAARPAPDQSTDGA